MAQGIKNICSHCQASIEAWDDGNPYYIDYDGIKKYAYHPDFERFNRCIGNDSPHICLDCGEQFMVDSRAPITECPKCESAAIVRTFRLEGKECPFCKTGVFERKQFAIS
jgi:DNA-directed RNA polymerase subunit RPC12/RpoP